MHVDELRIAFARTGRYAVKDKLLRSRYFQKGQIFQRRSDEDQIVVLGIIEREQAAALHAYLPMENCKQMIEFMHRQDFAHPGVVVEDGAAVGVFTDVV